MSSARPITRDDLMPGAGSSSYSVTTGTRIGLHDLAAHAEILQHAFERARIGFQLGLAERLAIAGLGRGQHGHGRKLELVGGFLGSGFRCGLLARSARGRLLLFLLLVFLFLVLVLVILVLGLRRDRGRGAAAEIGLLPAERNGLGLRSARNQRAVGRAEQPDQPCLGAHQARGTASPATPSRDRSPRLHRAACRRPRSPRALRRARVRRARRRSGRSRPARRTG